MRLVAFITAILSSQVARGSYPRAQNVTWNSTNFKTVLMWEPKPSEDYSYTVEFSVLGENKRRSPYCIRSSATVCDLSSSLTDIMAVYTADILSEPPLGDITDLIEFPHTSAPRFCPYKDTDIGKPDFKLEVSEDKRVTTLYVKDPLTALFKDGNQLNLREIFGDQLQYKVTYRKKKSTGKKVHISQSSVITFTELDQRESYCFSVQAFIPSRSFDKQLGELTHPKCSSDDSESIFEVYSVGVIAAAIFLILLVIGLITAVTAVCCKQMKKTPKSGQEGMALNSV